MEKRTKRTVIKVRRKRESSSFFLYTDHSNGTKDKKSDERYTSENIPTVYPYIIKGITFSIHLINTFFLHFERIY